MLQRAALGRDAQLGHFYDAVKDACLGPAFTEDVPFTTSDCDVEDKIHWNICNDNFVERCTALGIGPDLQASIIAGWVELRGYRVLGVDADVISKQGPVLVLSVKTKCKEGKFDINKYSRMVDCGTIRQATHMVVGVTWGTFAVFTFGDPKGQLDVSDIQEHLLQCLNDHGAIPLENDLVGEIQLKGLQLKSPPTDVQTVDLRGSFSSVLNDLKQLADKTSKIPGDPIIYRLKSLTELEQYPLKMKCSRETEASLEAQLKSVIAVVVGAFSTNKRPCGDQPNPPHKKLKDDFRNALMQVRIGVRSDAIEMFSNNWSREFPEWLPSNSRPQVGVHPNDLDDKGAKPQLENCNRHESTGRGRSTVGTNSKGTESRSSRVSTHQADDKSNFDHSAYPPGNANRRNPSTTATSSNGKRQRSSSNDADFEEELKCCSPKRPTTKNGCTAPGCSEKIPSRSDKNEVHSATTKTSINILLLGESGVGKSTWINAFYNYLKFDSLKKAEGSELHYLIPPHFTLTDSDYNSITIDVGTDNNESHATGQSSTQSCRVYRFELKDAVVQLIDTPGIGDTRGLYYDEVNVRSISKTLSEFPTLNGICILLHPQQSKFSVEFRYCVGSLLSRLHRDVAPNIMFCFTRSATSFYRQGETVPLLKQYLENERINVPRGPNQLYCFESEAFRYLAVIKKCGTSFPFTSSERKRMVESWTHSIKETTRMLKYIKKLPPQPTKLTLSLSSARDIISNLAEPLTTLGGTFYLNTQRVKHFQRELTRGSTGPIYLRRVQCESPPQPKTICLNGDCNSICCTDCQHLPYSLHGRIGDECLKKCHSLKNGHCVTCGHSYKEHVYQRYALQQIECPVTVNLPGADQYEERKRLMAYESELKTIKKVVLELACFLSHNSITHYDDEMIRFMEGRIYKEQEKAKRNVENHQLQFFTEWLQEYQTEFAQKTSDPVDSIESTISLLSDLPNAGNVLTAILGSESQCDSHSTRPVSKVFVEKSLFF